MEIIKIHYTPSTPVKSFDQIKTQAEELMKFIVEISKYRKCYAIHHSQVSENPFNFFVVHPEHLLGEEALFEDRVIINPEIVEVTKVDKPGFIDYCRLNNLDPKTLDLKTRDQVTFAYNKFVADWPQRYMKEGCMSFPFRKEKNVLRYPSITVKYQNPHMDKKTITIYGIAAEIFQHEIDHALGKNIYLSS